LRIANATFFINRGGGRGEGGVSVSIIWIPANFLGKVAAATHPLGILLIREAHASDAARLADDVDVIPCCRGGEDSLSAASERTRQGGGSGLLW
jgi:hypothetical protein